MQYYTRSACWSNDGTEVQGLEKAELYLLGKASTGGGYRTFPVYYFRTLHIP